VRPYYEHGGITIYHGDCREVMPSLSAFDLLLTDPPYGIGVCNRSDGGVGSIVSGSKFYGRAGWDHRPVETELLILATNVARVSIVWGGNYFSLGPSPCWLVWDKQQRDFTFADAELAWTNLEKAVRVFGYSRGALVAEGKDHPTQKPEPLMAWCIGLAGDAVANVLDPFMGSGTTLVAAKRLGRKAIGIEIEERYCEIAAKRLAQDVLPMEVEPLSDSPHQQSLVLQ
jgi:site-specific DNA-methyltransferase (adenine-specific)